MTVASTQTTPTFANGGVPLSVEGIQSQIRLHRKAFDQYAYPILKAAERDLDRLTMEFCADQRRQGKKLDDWLLKAEIEAFMRIKSRKPA
jgi:hypothetical protein